MIMSGAAIDQAYEILSVRPTEPPSEMEGTDWHCYVITQGNNTIRGYRQGNLSSVTRSVEEIVLRLNERRVGKRGRVHLDMSTKSSSAGKK
ncbi:MAG: hypothetical protein OEV41_02335 [Gammaproteobacteria bacterium]|nr:hypothetical protein [Gammaproteobacteria bacterium]